MTYRKVMGDRYGVFKQQGVYRSFKYIITRPLKYVETKIMGAIHIYENVWLGSAEDFAKFNGFRVSVRGEDVTKESDGYIPYTLLKTVQIGSPDEAKDLIDMLINEIETLQWVKPTLVHCTAGIDRSPFAVMCWLVLKKGFTVEEAYSMIKEARPIITEHWEWVSDLREKGVLPKRELFFQA